MPTSEHNYSQVWSAEGRNVFGPVTAWGLETMCVQVLTTRMNHRPGLSGTLKHKMSKTSSLTV